MLPGRLRRSPSTDIEGSTRLLQQLGDQYAEVLAPHHRLLCAAIQEAHGHEVDTQEDAVFAAFPRWASAGTISTGELIMSVRIHTLSGLPNHSSDAYTRS